MVTSNPQYNMILWSIVACCQQCPKALFTHLSGVIQPVKQITAINVVESNKDIWTAKMYLLIKRMSFISLKTCIQEHGVSYFSY